MTTTPVKEVTENETGRHYNIDNSGLPPAAFVYNAGAEMLRKSRTKETLELPRHAYRQVTRERNLSELQKNLTNGEFLYARGRLRITSQKELQEDESFRYFICFALEPA